MPVYLLLAEQLRDGPIAQSFEPLGYPWLISISPAGSLLSATRLLHPLFFVVFVTLVLRVTASTPRSSSCCIWFRTAFRHPAARRSRLRRWAPCSACWYSFDPTS